MAAAGTSHLRVRVDGKFFRLGERKFYAKGVCYGPFAPDARNESFASLEQTRRDFGQIRELGANVLRVYHVPPRWLLDLAAEHELKILIDVPWHKNRCFLDSAKTRAEVCEAVREAVGACLGHPAVFAFSVANEISPDVVRWSGAETIGDFIDELVSVAKATDPECLCTFANYPSTEFLRAHNLDFLCFNVYLHHRRALENYLARLQMQADAKPLVLGEFGIDSLREGEANKSEILSWQIEAAFRAGLAGAVVFSFTDDWFKAGRRIEDWGMGLTTRDRQTKDSFFSVRNAFQTAPYFPLNLYPKVSVVVACYNGARTLKSCLDSLLNLNYPDYEVILVDDGSTDATPQIASLYKTVRYFRQANHGLAVARNSGIAAATGEIIAFTDADCRADEDWLYYLTGDLLNSRFAGIGGPNYLPPEDSPVAAAVMVSPGGPAHVMLTDRIAEHIPGCNMAFYKWVLEEIGNFDSIFRRAGDDVDICWRLQQQGYRIGFSPAAFVWHYRRSTIHAYLSQQHGYGEAEALLVRKHPEYFNLFGGSIWRGHIYTGSKFGVVVRQPIIYHGLFGAGLFQTLYAAEPALTLMLCTTLEYYVLITLPLLVLSVPFHFMLPVALTSLLISLVVCVAAGVQADLPKNQQHLWSRPLVALLFFLQPITRGWARYQGRLSRHPTPKTAEARLESLQQRDRGQSLEEVYYWTMENMDRVDFVHGIIARLGQQGWPSKADSGWCAFDVEIFGNRWARLQLTTVTEELAGNQRLFRCRLRGAWSLMAKIAFYSLLGFELLIIGVVSQEQPWLWMLLLTMPIFGWFVEQEKRNLQRLIAAFLDDIAKQRNLTKLEYRREEEKFVPVEP
jgi:glycosyltransferase involved in cell wall biosynthesis